MKKTSKNRVLLAVGYGHRITFIQDPMIFRVFFRLEPVTFRSVLARKSLKPDDEIIDLAIEQKGKINGLKMTEEKKSTREVVQVAQYVSDSY